MTTAMPVLETDRLLVRPFVLEDLESAHDVLSRAWEEPPEERLPRLPRRERWLRWSIANYEALTELFQPPYGDRAVVVKGDGQLIGSVGLVPAMGPFGRLPGWPVNRGSALWYPEVGMYWAVDPEHQGKGYATEAGRALVDFGFREWRLGRIVATTEHSNERSQAVMRKLGMQIFRHPDQDPAWFQVVGLLART